MGFRPLGNAGLWPPGDDRNDLDAPLRDLYAWCEEKDVPILAHCNETNGGGTWFRRSAAPTYWASVLEEFSELRLCLGHFGGVRGVQQDPFGSWAWQIAQLMRTYPFVYADTGFSRHSARFVRSRP